MALVSSTSYSYMARINAPRWRRVVGILSVIAMLIIETRSQVTDSQAINDLYIGSIDNVVLPEDASPVIVACPVLTVVDRVNWFMYDNDTFVNVSSGINYAISTIGQYYCQATEQRGVYRSNTFTVYRVGFADSFSLNPMSLLVHRTTTRFAFECEIDVFGRNESDFNRTRIEWEGASSGAPDLYQTQDNQNVFTPLPGYSILVINTNGLLIDMFPDRYRCIAVFTLQDGLEVIAATSEPGLLIIDGEGSTYDGDLFLLSPSNKTITEMDRAAFACVPADSMFQASWLTSFPSFVTGPNNYYLLVENVERTLPISCSINGTIASSTLTVQEIPIAISTLPNTTLVQEGTSLTLQCQVLMTTPTPTIIWLVNGATVQVSTAENYTIIVNSTSEGIYQCLVEASFIVSTNSVGLPPTYSFISTTFVDTYCVPNITVIVNRDPSVRDIMIGNSFNITCQPSCPTASVTWRRDDVIISNSSSTAVTIDGFSVVYLMDGDGLVERSVLRNSMAVLNDSANYQCISVVQGIETADNITIFVYARAIIIAAPEDLAVALGENATFTCVASGHRTPDVSWFQINNNSLVLIDSESETVSDNGTITSTLLIRNAMANDFGNYFCMASNEFSIARANFTLSQAEVPNVPVNIQLIENGSRTTNITWQDGISPIPGNPPADSYQVSLLNNSRIDIFDVSTTSIFLDPLLPFTNYTITIVARNRIGFSNNSEPFSFVTNEESPGGAPQDLDADSLALGTINISWTPPSTELQYGIITGYQIYYNIAGTNDINSNFTVDLNITLTGLLDDTEYQITVAAQNGAGVSTINASVATSTITPPINIDNITLPNGTVPSDRINPNAIIVELPTTDQPFSHAWVAAVRLSSANSPVLTLDTNEVYPTVSSFESYATAADDEAYIVAEISRANFPMLFPLGDNSSSFAISDFPDIYFNGPLTEGSVYSVFVRYFSPRPQVTRTKRIVNGERQYNVFTSTSFFPPVSTADTISFNQSVYDADEENELIQIVLVLTNPLPNNTVIQVISSNINATESDYISGPYNVTILAGNTLGLLDIAIINDNIVEETEIFNLVINASSLPERVFAGNTSSTIVNILDSDVAEIGFNQTIYSIIEDTGLVQLTLVLSKLLLTDITVNISSTSSNATGGVDYSPAGPYSATIPAGMTNVSFSISINPDNILEGDEVFLLTIDQISIPTVIVSDDSALVVIIDDDSIMLNFSQSLYVVNEADGVVQPELILSNPSSTDFTVSIVTNSITATRGSDYDPGPYNLTIPAGNTNLQFTVPLAIDNIVELDEEFELRIDRVSLAVLISADPTRVVIVDNDTAIVSFVQSTYSVNETDELVEVEMILSDPSSTNITVQVANSDINATGDVDYDAGLYSVMFAAGEVAVSFNISITDDNVLEVVEEFSLTIMSNSFPTRIFSGIIQQTTVFIIDNDDIVVNFSRAMYDVVEGNGVVRPELIFSNPSSFDITVQVMATDMSAAGVNSTECVPLNPDNDYTMGLYNVTFPVNVTTRSVDIPVCDDRVFEGNERFSVLIISNSSPDNVISGGLDQATVIIVDDDLVTISFNQMMYRANESDGVVEIIVSFSNPSTTDIIVQIVSSDITAINGTDFVFVPLNITFLAGSITNVFSITIRDDDLFEINETFDLNMILSSSTPLSIANRTTTVVIVDNDPVVVNFSQPVYTVEENSRVAEIQLIFSNPSSIDITIEVNSEEINATGDFDYDPGPYNISFSAGETFKSFNITILDNNTYEASESFNLIISPHSFVLFGTPRQAVTTITDEDDIVIINFDQPAYTVNENNGPAQIMLILSNPSVFDITLQIVSNGLSGDYISGPYEVLFIGGVTSNVLNITIVDDNLLEPVEIFNLTISSLFGDATIGNLDNTMISIFDNDAITVQFTQPLYTVAEESRVAQPELIFSNPSYTDINVTILNMEIDATENVDYDYPGPYNVTVPAGDTRVVFTISITNDSENEGTERFSVIISSANLHPNVSIGTVDTTTVSIVDDSALIQFAQSSYRINEGIGTLRVEVTVSEPLNVDIAVHIITSDISTTGGDYRCDACNRTLMAGMISVPFNITITDDNILELDEDFMLSNISTVIPSSSTISVMRGSPESTAVVIEDNDFVLVNFSQSTYNANESSEMAEVDVRFSNPSSTPITVQVTTRDISANSRVQNNDYSPGPFTITFPPGRMNSLLRIAINDDNVLEGNETFNLTVRVINSLILSRVSTGNVNQVTVTILDNDPITVTFEQPTYSVSEELITVQPVLVFSNPSQSDITVQVMNTDVSTSAMDYVGGPYSVSFLARRTRTVFTISITNDNILEVNESFSLVVDPAVLPSNVASTDQTIITITDNDTLTINFSQETYFVNENNVSMHARLILSDPSSRDITVQIDTFDNNATGGLDYDSGPHNVVITAGETEVTFSVTIHNDTILERTESFTLSMNSTLFETNRIIIGSVNSALVLINDTSGPLTVEFSSNRFEGVESSMQLPITLSLGRGTSAFDITVSIMPFDQSPVSAEGNGIDYDSALINATFPSGATSSTINVSVILDSILEQWETFELTFTILASIQDVVIEGRQTTAVGVIIDTTNATISFAQSVYTIVEDDTILQVALNMSNEATFDVSAQINSIENGSAVGNVDYISGPVSITFPAGVTAVSFNVSTIIDNTLEVNETYILAVAIIPSSLTNSSVNITTSNTTIIIIDDDPINVTFNQSAYTTTEDDGFLQFALLFTNPSAFEISITVVTSDLTAMGNADFNAGPHVVQFAINTTMASFNISITVENILEIDENFMFEIDPAMLIPQVFLGNISQASGLIIDDDPITVTFGSPMYRTTEESELARPNLTFSNPSSFDITVQVMITDNTATGVNNTECTANSPNNDYTMGLYNVTFNTMMTESFIDIPVCNDIVLEEDETFRLMIVSNSLHPNVTSDNPSQVEVTIIDNDPITVNFSQSTFQANESNGTLNGRAFVVAMLSNPSYTATTVQVQSNGITATSGGTDFTFAPRSITFPEGETSYTIDVEINDDNIFELGNETFDLSLTSVLFPQSLPITIANGVAIVVILDDDPIRVNFSRSAYNVDENSQNLPITLIFSNPSSTAITIRVNSSPQTATRRFDYDPGPYDVTFPDLTTTASFDIRIFDNQTFETSEQFSLTINPPNFVFQGTPSEVTATILDHRDIVLVRPFQSVILLEGTRITLSCFPTLFPEEVPLNWTSNGIRINESTSGITFSPRGLNHNLTIEAPTATDSGIYRCIAAPTVNQTINVTVLETCEAEFNGALLWPASQRSRLVTQRCSALHPSFRSGVMIRRQCDDRGDWSPVSIQDCTMFENSNPLVIVYFTVNATEDDPSSTVNNVLSAIDSLSLGISDITRRNVSIPGSDLVAFAISFTLSSKTARTDIIDIARGALLQSDPDFNFGVLAFQPSGSCLCDAITNTNIDSGLLTVCVGPSTPPCNSNNMCNTPTFVGNGSLCGLDTDFDGFPDVKLNCSVEQSSCTGDLCPEIYSLTSDGTQSGSFCNNTLTTTGCQAEVDSTWSISWPATQSGEIATQKCPGGSEAEGLTTRLCISDDNWADPDVSLCRTVEQVRLADQAADIQRIADNILSTTTRDLTVMYDPQVVVNIADELGNITDTTLVPNDASTTADTLDIIVTVARDTTELIEQMVVVEVVEDATTVIDNLLDERNDISFQDGSEEKENRTVGERVLGSAEDVALLLVSTLDSNENGTMSRNITRDNIIMNAQRPTMDTIQTIAFPPADVQPMNITAPSIEISEDAVRFIFNEQGGNLAVVSFLAVNFDRRLPIDEGDNIASAVISSQTSSADSRTRVPLGNNTITLRASLTMAINETRGNPRCAFWDFTRNNQTGGFSEEGLMIASITNERIECVSNHLTSFAILVSTQTPSTSESTALSIVTYIGCGISIVCIIITIIAFIIFRKKIFNHLQHFIHLNLAVALLIGLVLFVSAIETVSDSRVGCLTVAVLLHYFFMAMFCWMLCEGILLLLLLYFVFYKGFFKSWKFFTIIGWGTPIPIVAISAGISHEHYGSNGRCWISNTDGAIWGFIGPMLLIILINAILLTATIIKVFQSKNSQITAERRSLFNSVMASAKAAVILLPVFGLTWVFGLLAVNEDTVVFAWIFTVINSIQGLFILVFYVLKNEKFQKAIKGCVRYDTASTTASSTDKSGTLQTNTGRRFGRSTNPRTFNRAIEEPRTLQRRNLDTSLDTSLGYRNDSAETAERNVEEQASHDHRLSHVVFHFDEPSVQREEIDN